MNTLFQFRELLESIKLSEAHVVSHDSSGFYSKGKAAYISHEAGQDPKKDGIFHYDDAEDAHDAKDKAKTHAASINAKTKIPQGNESVELEEWKSGPAISYVPGEGPGKPGTVIHRDEVYKTARVDADSASTKAKSAEDHKAAIKQHEDADYYSPDLSAHNHHVKQISAHKKALRQLSEHPLEESNPEYDKYMKRYYSPSAIKDIKKTDDVPFEGGHDTAEPKKNSDGTLQTDQSRARAIAKLALAKVKGRGK